MEIILQYIITIGGILLILGAVFMYFGKVYYSSLMYLFADICWSINAFYSGDIIGSISVNIGLLLGLLTMRKMHIGIFNKTLY